ncbi:MAG: aspartate aminotransferase family protein, partial [Dactylosporangium sp.]|nr:aspartate aminotransferase family protein [Dactylosporangium sp.]
RFLHTDFTVTPYASLIELADRLAPMVPGRGPKKGAFFNSGAEAVENAVKVAKKATGRPAVIAFERAFHGRTWMAMSLTSRVSPYKAGYGPYVPEVYRAPYPYVYRSESGDPEVESERCLEQLRRMFRHTVDPDTVAAIIYEPVQGEGGFVVPPASFLRGVEEIAREHGILTIDDEVQTGFGRTGRMFAAEHFGLAPDIVTMAKSIAGGMPLSAVFGRAEVMDAPEANTIGGTFVGNPVACAAGLAVLDAFEEGNLVEEARRSGERIMRRFTELKERHPLVGDVRGLGAMVAMELVKDRETKEPATQETSRAIRHAIEHGVICLSAGMWGNCIRVLAPLAIPDDQIDEAVAVLDDALSFVESGTAAGVAR